MGRNKILIKRRLQNYVNEFGSTLLKTDGSSLFCIPCDHGINHTKNRSNITHHIDSSIHQEKVKRAKVHDQPFIAQAFRGETETKQQRFNKDLCRMLVESDIPLSELNHPSVRSFFEKWTSMSIPDESTLRKNYMPKLSDESIRQLQARFEIQQIWVGIDEVCDKTNRSFGAVVVADSIQADGRLHMYFIWSNLIRSTVTLLQRSSATLYEYSLDFK